jgi:hypothetical protein
MQLDEIAKPLGVFVVVILVALAGTAILSLVAGGGSAPDGQNVQGQSPGQYQPDAVNEEPDPEEGNLSVGTPEGEKKILIDTGHSNRFEADELEPMVEALAEAGHEVDVGTGSQAGGGGFGQTGYNETLQEYDALLVISPQAPFTEGERKAIDKYVGGGGRVVVLGEATQPSVSSGRFGLSLSQETFGANGMTENFGMRMGADVLYNLDDDATDNNFKQIYAETSSGGILTEEVDTINLDVSGYIVPVGDTDATVKYTAAEGTRALESDRTGEYPVVVRNEGVVFVADSEFVERSEVYDADNEVFVSNIMQFLVSGTKPDDVPESPSSDGGFGGGNGGSSGGSDEPRRTPSTSSDR